MGMHEAWQSSVPLIVFVDGTPPQLVGKHALYEHDTAGVVRVFSKAIVEARAPRTYPEQLRKAFRIATTGRPGPVVFHALGGNMREFGDEEVEIYAEPEYARFPARRAQPDLELVREAARLLTSANQPVIVAGGGVNLARAWDELRELADLTQFPVATTISGKGAFDEHHPLSVGATGDVQGGRYGRGRIAGQIVKDADVVLLVGSRANQMATSSWTVPDPGSTLIHIDVDHENVGRNYRTDVGIVADARLALRALTDALRAEGFTPRTSRTEEIRRLLDEWAEDSSAFLGSDQVPIHPGRLVGEVSQLVGPNTIVVSDGSSPFMWASSHLLVSAGPTFISPRGTGAIGTGLPMAVGAKLAAPDRDVICFEGDGGIMCGILGELETAARCNVGVTTVVFNNATLGHERFNMHGGLEYMDFLPGIDFATVARGLKCEGIRVERPEEIRPALLRGLENGRAGRPTLVDVVIHPGQYLRAPLGFDQR
jgi:acetolactate synthase-1/2/3 large subunit